MYCKSSSIIVLGLLFLCQAVSAEAPNQTAIIIGSILGIILIAAIIIALVMLRVSMNWSFLPQSMSLMTSFYIHVISLVNLYMIFIHEWGWVRISYPNEWIQIICKCINCYNLFITWPVFWKKIILVIILCNTSPFLWM